MSEKKTIKRSVRTVWDNVKLLRSERSKLYAAGDIKATADQLARHAVELKHLADQLSSLSAMPAAEPQIAPAKRKQKRKAPQADQPS